MIWGTTQGDKDVVEHSVIRNVKVVFSQKVIIGNEKLVVHDRVMRQIRVVMGIKDGENIAPYVTVVSGNLLNFMTHVIGRMVVDLKDPWGFKELQMSIAISGDQLTLSYIREYAAHIASEGNFEDLTNFTRKFRWKTDRYKRNTQWY